MEVLRHTLESSRPAGIALVESSRQPPIRVGRRRPVLAPLLLWTLLVCSCSGASQADGPDVPGAALGPPPSAPPADQYGGVARGVARPTGYFQVKQVGDRWMFVTPEGNGMWMIGVFDVIYSDSVDDLGSSGKSRVMAKYGGADWQERWRK